MSSLNFVYRPSTKKGRHPGSLFLRLIQNQQVKTITLKGCRIYPDEWDKPSQTVIFPKDNVSRVTYLKKVESKINNEIDTISGFILSLEDKGNYSLDDLMEMYYHRYEESTLRGYVTGLVKTLNSHGQKRTARAYLTVTHGLLRFSRNENLLLCQINSCLARNFETYLKNKELLPNTISFYMRNLRAIFNKAVAEKRVILRKDEAPFAHVFTGIAKTMERALDIDETKKFLNLDLEALPDDEKRDSCSHTYPKQLSTAHRYFSFCLYARGMCFVDLACLKKSNIRNGFIRYVRKKTGQQIEVRITANMQAIIDSFAEETACSLYVFPVICDPDKPTYSQYESGLRVQNNRLKKLAALAGIDKPVSTHWARHTWANVGKSIHLPTTVIGEGLGHTSESTTLIYLSRLNNSELDDANDLITRTIDRHRVGTSRMLHPPCCKTKNKQGD